MNIIQAIRDLTGFQASKVIIEDEQGNLVDAQQLAQRRLESLQDVVEKAEQLISEITSRYDEDDQILELKIEACDIFLKAQDSEDVKLNKTFLTERRQKLLNDFVSNAAQIHRDLDEAIDELNQLQKAEGTRGGHIIGHTKSGKAIYDSFSHPNSHIFHFNYSRRCNYVSVKWTRLA